MKAIWTILLLIASNVFMTFAWYGHLKLQEMKISSSWPLILVILFSWGVAFFEYCAQVPANRIGFVENGGPFNLMQLKIIQEVMGMFGRVYVEITNICNMNCSFCHGHRRALRRMSAEEFGHILTALTGKTGYVYYHLMGEPLTHQRLPEFLRMAKEAGFRVSPLSVTIAGNTYREFDEISSEEFVELIRQGYMPTSSQPAIGEVEDMYNQFPGEEIINVSMALGLSGTYTSAVAAAQQRFGLPQTGRVDLNTWDEIYDQYSGIENTTWRDPADFPYTSAIIGNTNPRARYSRTSTMTQFPGTDLRSGNQDPVRQEAPR